MVALKNNEPIDRGTVFDSPDGTGSSVYISLLSGRCSTHDLQLQQFAGYLVDVRHWRSASRISTDTAIIGSATADCGDYTGRRVADASDIHVRVCIAEPGGHLMVALYSAPESRWNVDSHIVQKIMASIELH